MPTDTSACVWTVQSPGGRATRSPARDPETQSPESRVRLARALLTQLETSAPIRRLWKLAQKAHLAL